MAREFIMPKQIISGTGALDSAKHIFSSMGKKALIVTDKVMVELGNCRQVEDVLSRQNIGCAVFDGITGEPTDEMIRCGLAVFKEQECDFLIGLGGGSPIDSMKAIAFLSKTENKAEVDISTYMGREIDAPVPPMAAVPTTAGTGSEATQFTIITDTKKDIKMLLKGRVLIPDVAVIDPRFTMTAPAKITAATGLDALCHAVEAYTSRKAQTMSDTFAVSAVKRIFKYLPAAFKDGKDEKARIEMSVAALEAGIAFNNASVTLIHGMSRPIGALFHVPHGLSNAMLMRECLAFALPGAVEKFAHLGRVIKAASDEDDDKKAGQKFIEEIERLVKVLEIPTPKQYGIDRKRFFDCIEKMAYDAMESGSPQNTVREISQPQIEEMYARLWNHG